MYVAQSICIWDSVWQAWVSQIIYYSDLLASPLPPPPTQLLAPFWLKYLMFASDFAYQMLELMARTLNRYTQW